MLIYSSPLVTRDKKGFFVTHEQAVLVASEWEAQEKYISLAKMPLVFPSHSYFLLF